MEGSSTEGGKTAAAKLSLRWLQETFHQKKLESVGIIQVQINKSRGKHSAVAVPVTGAWLGWQNLVKK